MSLFQKSVVLKYLPSQNKTVLQEKWQQFQNSFQIPTIQENTRNSKEEQYQGEFLIDLLVSILGFTKKPQQDFNLTTGYKNLKDSKKANRKLNDLNSNIKCGNLLIDVPTVACDKAFN